MGYQRIEIKTSKKGAAFTDIFIDGYKLEGVRNFKLEHRPNAIPKLTMELNALDIAVDRDVLLFAESFGEMEINFKKPQESGSKIT